MPLFDNSGPICLPAPQVEECRCTECMMWDPLPEIPAGSAPRWYEIERTDPGGGFAIVGMTMRVDSIDEDGNPQTQPPANVWCFAKDSPMPFEGQLYGYRVRGGNLSGAGGWSLGIEYTAAPYAIDQFRPPIQGN